MKQKETPYIIVLLIVGLTAAFIALIWVLVDNSGLAMKNSQMEQAMSTTPAVEETVVPEESESADVSTNTGAADVVTQVTIVE